MADLTDTVKADIYRQMSLCRETYKPIFAALAKGVAPEVNQYFAEVQAYYEMLAAYATIERRVNPKYDYLAALDDLDEYLKDPLSVYNGVWIKDGKQLDRHRDEKTVGIKRVEMLRRFEFARQALDRLAYDLGLVSATGGHEGMTK
jgi:hypothetical protein